tara:strand:- start:1151 stop:1546 length:396 start_codon:yes stop_codon:yes gene_type:complete
MAHTRRHRYCPTCATNLDVLEQVVRDLQDISAIIGAGAMGTMRGMSGQDNLTPRDVQAAQSARDLLGRVQAIQGASRPSRKRKSPKQAAYARAFKKMAPRYKKKSGGWKKNGFKNCAAAARREVKKNGKKK